MARNSNGSDLDLADSGFGFGDENLGFGRIRIFTESTGFGRIRIRIHGFGRTLIKIGLVVMVGPQNDD